MAEFKWDDFPAEEKAEERSAASTTAPAASFNWDEHPEESAPAKAPEGGILDKVGRGLDWAGGMARTGLANSPAMSTIDVLQAYLRSKDSKDMLGKMVNRPGDQERALVGKAPRTDEYLERAGMPEGGHVSDYLPGLYTKTPEEAAETWRLKMAKGGLLDPTPRGTLGFVGDTVTDPLTHGLPIAKAAEEIPLLNKFIKGSSQPLAKGAENAGEAYYKSAFKKADAAAGDWKNPSKLSPSEIALEEGMWGKNKALEGQAKDLVERVTAEKKALLPQIKNQQIDPAKAWSPDLAKKIKTLMSDPNTAEVADKVLDDIKEYGLRGATTPEQIWLYQKNLTRAASGASSNPGNAFKSGASFNHYKEIQKQMAHDLGTLLEKEAAATSPELAAKLKETNQVLSPMIRAQKPLRSATKIEANRKGPLSQLGAALFAAGVAAAAHTGGASMLPYAAYAGAKIAGNPAARTGGGLVLNRAGRMLGEANLLDPIARRALINKTEPGTWMNAIKQQNGGSQ